MKHTVALETVFVDVPEAAMEYFEAALNAACATVGFFRDERTEMWRIEGVKQVGAAEEELATALLLAEALTGVSAPLQRVATEAGGWLARTKANFPEQFIGARFAVRGTHVETAPTPGRITLLLDAGVAFGSGEHGSTRGCLRALEWVARFGPRRILDMGTGSGILAIAAAKLMRRRVLATDIEPWSVRVTAENAAMNGVEKLVRAKLANGWLDPTVRGSGPYDLVLANILARPLCAMARDLAVHLAPGGRVILAGLLATQINMVLAAHRRHGLVLERVLREDRWATLVLRA